MGEATEPAARKPEAPLDGGDDLVVVGPGERTAMPLEMHARPRARPREHRMVGWYDLRQLPKTALDVVVSTLFGRHADQRLIEALSTAKPEFHDYSTEVDEDGELWLDFVADVGDGFASTLRVANEIAKGTLSLADKTLRRGKILVFGGDEVYPVASLESYDVRTEYPYAKAFGETTHHPDLFAIPGNHDWYDNLVAFTRRFCSRRPFAGCRTLQTRSYFALRLPYKWWLVGTDLQLGSEIDAAQLAYFRKVAARIAAEDGKVILCHAEPHWMLARKYRGIDASYDDSNLRVLEDQVLKNRVRVFIAGDQHHYLRYSNEPESTGEAVLRPPPVVHKITSGGGGAFLHPTHEKPTSLDGGFELRKRYPEKDVSSRLTWRNLWFAKTNPTFGILTGLLYVLTCAAFAGETASQALRGRSFDWSASGVIATLLHTPPAIFWVAFLILGVLMLTDTRSLAFRLIAGPVHAAVHLAAVYGCGRLAALAWEAAGLGPIAGPLLFALVVFVCGWLLGATLMGLYLIASLQGFGRHANEAFSALRWEGHKNFLRMRVAPDGSLKIYAIGMDDVRQSPAHLIEAVDISQNQ